MRRAVQALLLLIAVVAVLITEAAACSVPVFRYALERWPSDLFEVDIFHKGPLTAAQQATVSQLEDRSLVNGGDRNWEVVPCDIEGDLASDLRAVWEEKFEAKRELPLVVLRCPGGRQGSPLVWSGPLFEVERTLAASRSEQELTRRLLSGDAVVWLILRGTDAEQAERAAKLLAEQVPTLMSDIELPAGVGLPGSELLARIPLEVRFSILDIAAEDAANSGLRRTAIARSENSVEAATTLIVPVFGRGRVMQVLTADELDADVVAESCRFLCGACSCQVKQLNPGFDLLLPVAWDERLYGDEVPAEAIAEPTNPAVTEPTYVAIPTGDQPAITVASMSARPATFADDAANRAMEAASKSSANGSSSDPPATDWYLLGACVLMVGALYIWRRQSAWSRRNSLSER